MEAPIRDGRGLTLAGLQGPGGAPAILIDGLAGEEGAGTPLTLGGLDELAVGAVLIGTGGTGLVRTGGRGGVMDILESLGGRVGGRIDMGQVSGLDAPTAGRILIDGSPVTGIDSRCAVAFQEPRLLPWRTLAQNVSIGLPRGTDRTAGAQRVNELLELVGLGECTTYRPRLDGSASPDRGETAAGKSAP